MQSVGYVAVCLSLRLSVCVSFCPSVSISVSHSLYLNISSSVCLSRSLFVSSLSLSLCLPMSICPLPLSISLLVCACPSVRPCQAARNDVGQCRGQISGQLLELWVPSAPNQRSIPSMKQILAMLGLHDTADCRMLSHRRPASLLLVGNIEA